MIVRVGTLGAGDTDGVHSDEDDTDASDFSDFSSDSDATDGDVSDSDSDSDGDVNGGDGGNGNSNGGGGGRGGGRRQRVRTTSINVDKFRTDVEYLRGCELYTYREKIEHLAVKSGCSASTAARRLAEYNLSVTASSGGGRGGRVVEIPLPSADEIHILRENNPDATLAQLAAMCDVSTERFSRQVRRLGIVRPRVSQEDVHAAVLEVRVGPFSKFGATLTQGRAYLY